MQDPKSYRTLCFARWCWQKRNQYAPKPEYDDRGREEYITWAEVFKRRTGLSLDEYRRVHGSHAVKQLAVEDCE